MSRVESANAGLNVLSGEERITYSVFLISPFGTSVSDKREEVNALRLFLKKALNAAPEKADDFNEDDEDFNKDNEDLKEDNAIREEFKLVRGDEQDDQFDIPQAIEEQLRESDLVVAYLGRQNWGFSPNVMYEIGYRRATGRPLLLIAHEGDELPFDIQSYRHTLIPPCDEGVNRLAYEDYVDLASSIRKTARTVLSASRPQQVVASDMAMIDLRIDRTPNMPQKYKLEKSLVTWCTEEAEKLFHVNFNSGNTKRTLIGMQINKVPDLLKPRVEQWDHFDTEQATLLGRLINGAPNVKATIPFIFKDDSEVDTPYRGAPYLAMILHHQEERTAITMRVLYLRLPRSLNCTEGIWRVHEDKEWRPKNPR